MLFYFLNKRGEYMKNKLFDIIIKAKLHDTHKKDRLLLVRSMYSFIFHKKITLTNEWVEYKFECADHRIEIASVNADIIVEKLNTINSSVFTVLNIYVDTISFNTKLNNSHLNLRCRCIDMTNITQDNIGCENSLVNGTTTIIVNDPVFLTRKNLKSFFRNYNGSYISNKFIFGENIEDLSYIFCDSSIKTIPLSFKFNKNITNIDYLCGYCKKLKHLYKDFGTISKKRYRSLKTPVSMFHNCRNLNNIPMKFYKKHYINEREKLYSNFIGLLSIVHDL